MITCFPFQGSLRRAKRGFRKKRKDGQSEDSEKGEIGKRGIPSRESWGKIGIPKLKRSGFQKGKDREEKRGIPNRET